MERNSYSSRLKIDESGLFQGKLDMELTERCNNNCIHCYINLPADDRSAMEKELSTEELKEILKEAATLDYLTVRFTGGEPLLRCGLLRMGDGRRRRLRLHADRCL